MDKEEKLDEYKKEKNIVYSFVIYWFMHTSS